MFEEADAVGDARGFLTGTGHSSAFSEEGRAESALGPFPPPWSHAPRHLVRGPWAGGASIWSRLGDGPRQRASLPFCFARVII